MDFDTKLKHNRLNQLQCIFIEMSGNVCRYTHCSKMISKQLSCCNDVFLSRNTSCLSQCGQFAGILLGLCITFVWKNSALEYQILFPLLCTSPWYSVLVGHVPLKKSLIVLSERTYFMYIRNTEGISHYLPEITDKLNYF